MPRTAYRRLVAQAAAQFTGNRQRRQDPAESLLVGRTGGARKRRVEVHHVEVIAAFLLPALRQSRRIARIHSFLLRLSLA